MRRPISTFEPQANPVSRRIQRRRGSAIVEFSLIWMPMFLLMFGTADVSLVVFLRSMMQNAVREATRFAITYSTTYNGTSCSSMTNCATAVVQSYTIGFLSGTVGGQAATSYIHVNYYAPDNLSTPVTAGSLPRTMANGTVINYVNQPGNLIEITIQNYPWNWLVPLPNYYGLQGLGTIITVSSVDVLQGLPIGTLAPPAS